MRILVVTQYFWPENFRITDLVLALKEKGHEVVVLTAMPNYPNGRLYDGYSWWEKRRDNMGDTPVFRVPIFLRRKSKSWHLILNYLSFVISACIIGPYFLRGKQFDVVFAYGPSPATVALPAILLAKLKKAKMFFWVQDLWPEAISATGAISSNKILSSVRCMMKKIYQYCDCILVQSESFIEPVVSVGADRNKVKYFPNWAEALYKPTKLASDAPERKEVPSNGFVVMFAGNLGVAQSLDSIISAADALKNENIYWVFLGDGRRRSWLEEVVDEKQLEKVVVLGSRPIETMPAYFSLADAMLVTLKDDPLMSTTIPGKLQSYLACGKPIIGALNGAGKKVIDNSFSGYSVKSDDVDALVDAVIKMSHLSGSKVDKMGDSARTYYVENFDRGKLINELEVWMQASNIKC